MSNSSIWPINRTLSGATTLGQSGLGSNGNNGILNIPQNSSITGASPSDCLMSYPGHLLRVGSLPLYRDADGVFNYPSWQIEIERKKMKRNNEVWKKGESKRWEKRWVTEKKKRDVIKLK